MAEDDTQIIGKADTNSNIFGVSVRAWVTIALVLGVVLNHLVVTTATLWHALTIEDFNLVGTLTTIGEPFYTLSSIGVGFYFGQKLKN